MKITSVTGLTLKRFNKVQSSKVQSVVAMSSPNCDTLVKWPSSLAAYPRTTLSSMVSLSSARM